MPADPPPRRGEPGAGGWVALVVSGVALSLALGLAISAVSSLPLILPIAVATAIVCRAYGVRGAGGWILALILIAIATGIAGIAIGFLFLSVAGR